MFKDFYYESKGYGTIYGGCWMPEGKPKAIVQIVHGIAEHIERYDHFARFLCSNGIMVVAQDHMGHGKSVCDERGYFTGGWFRAVEDTYQLLKDTAKEHPDVPYILFGHSMGSFITRTILENHPKGKITAAVICGTGWMPEAVLIAGKQACSAVCRLKGDKHHSKKLQNLVFSGYNKRIDNPRTEYDWLNTDPKEVDIYIDDPMCGFTVTAGLLRDMLTGILYIQKSDNLKRMCKKVPVLFVAGEEDPVGGYGKGVQKTAEVFRQYGMKDVTCKLYSDMRHEILNEQDKLTVYEDVIDWIEKIISKTK